MTQGGDMKLLVLLVVAIAVANGQWQPAEPDDQLCKACGDPIVRTYSGAYLMIFDNTKTLMTKWKDTADEKCKFEVDCVTAKSSCGDLDLAPTWIDWCGVSIWPHKNTTKFFRNYVFGQSTVCFLQRGQGGQSIETFPHSFPAPGEIPANWNGVPPPDPACPIPYTITYDAAANKITFKGDCCGWAVEFFPLCRDTCVNIWSKGNDTAKMGQMEGICGPMTGDPADDFRECFTHTPTMDLEVIGLTCRDFKHDGQGYTGGTKLIKKCGYANHTCGCVPEP